MALHTTRFPSFLGYAVHEDWQNTVWRFRIRRPWLSRDPLGYVDSENLYQGIEASTLVAMDSFGLATITIQNGPATICETSGGVTDCWQAPFGSTPYEVEFDDPDMITHCCGNGCKAWRINPAGTSNAECDCVNGESVCDGAKEITACSGRIGKIGWGRVKFTWGDWSKKMLCTLCRNGPIATVPPICAECCPAGVESKSHTNYFPYSDLIQSMCNKRRVEKRQKTFSGRASAALSFGACHGAIPRVWWEPHNFSFLARSADQSLTR